MKKYFVVTIIKKKINLRLLAEDAKLLEEKEYALLTVANALISIKNFITHQPVGQKEFYLVIDEEAKFHRLKTEGQKNKEELRSIWDIRPGDYFGYTERVLTGTKRIYYALSYSAELLDPYLNVLKKTGLICAGVLPLDFLYLQNLQAGVFAEKRDNKLLIRIFDRQGNFFYKKLFLSFAEKGIAAEIDKVLTYVARERTVAIENPAVQPDYQLDAALAGFNQKLQPTISIYSESRKDSPRRRKPRLSTAQKAIIIFLVTIILLMTIPFLQQLQQAIRIKKDIKQYQNNLTVITPQVKQLQTVEQKTKYLQSRKIANSRLLKSLLDYFQQSKLTVQEINYDNSKNLMSCILWGKDEHRNTLLLDLKKVNFIDSVNLIYIKPNAKNVEFKIIIKVK